MYYFNLTTFVFLFALSLNFYSKNIKFKISKMSEK